MVRAAYRLADRFRADWIVISIGTETEQNLTDQERRWLNDAMETARSLGGRIVRYRGGGDVPGGELIRYARQHNVTMIMLGKPPRGLDIFYSPVYRTMVRSKGIDIFLYEPKAAVSIPIHRQLPQFVSPNLIISAILIALVTIVNYFLRNVISSSNLLIIQLVPVVAAALLFRRGTAIITAIASILIFDFAFVAPYYTLTIDDWDYFISFVGGYVVIAFIISGLATRLRYLLPQIRRSEAKVEAVAVLSRDLVNVAHRQEIFDTLYRHMKQFGEGAFAVLTPGAGGALRERRGSRLSAHPKRADYRPVGLREWPDSGGERHRNAPDGGDRALRSDEGVCGYVRRPGVRVQGSGGGAYTGE
ncbi:DUF4118 domain-containing protein [Methanoculleus chikugoensis]|uniref:DUF4118 domain-containing protein n=1 Tax=Methanoculleus chikugoensis TaxID=118126 RepID=UPI0006D2B432|nr:DUF4118 domain-containing protein [Methanoculleus chikugoensis]